MKKLIAALSLGMLAPWAAAQSCPEKNVNYWQAFPPGGASDLSTRHQQVVFEDRNPAFFRLRDVDQHFLLHSVVLSLFSARPAASGRRSSGDGASRGSAPRNGAATGAAHTGAARLQETRSGSIFFSSSRR